MRNLSLSKLEDLTGGQYFNVHNLDSAEGHAITVYFNSIGPYAPAAQVPCEPAMDSTYGAG